MSNNSINFKVNPQIIDKDNIPEIWSIYHNGFIEIENLIVDESTAQERLYAIQNCLHRISLSTGKILVYNENTSTY